MRAICTSQSVQKSITSSSILRYHDPMLMVKLEISEAENSFSASSREIHKERKECKEERGDKPDEHLQTERQVMGLLILSQ